MKNIIFISLEFWDEVFRRNQFFAVFLMKDFNVYFVQPPIPFFKYFDARLKKHEAITLISIYKFFPDRFKITAWLNKILYIIQLKSKTPRKVEVLWINDHLKYYVCPKISCNKIIYDITDDWTKLNYSPVKSLQVKFADKKMCEIADIIIVCSETLRQSRNNYSNKIKLIRNGVDINSYQTDETIDLKIPSPILMYTGTLHEERIDFDLVFELATSHTKYSFVFVGPFFLYPSTLKKIALFHNIFLIGAVNYVDIPAYQNSADILIVPHIVSDFTNSLDPIKQYEYMCSSKPVITTHVNGFTDYQKLFSVASNSEEFDSFIRKHLSKGITVDLNSRITIAKENTWECRFEQVREILE